MPRRSRRLLTYDPAAGLGEGGVTVYSKLIGLTHSFGKDPAGHIFHDKALRQAGLLQDEPEEEDAGDDTESEATASRQGSTADFSSLNGGGDSDAKWQGKGRKKKVKATARADLYALLGLQHERWMATDAQIKAAYRRSALEHHPDKQRQATGGEEQDEATMQAAEDRFKAVQEAYETLCDPAKRREFDSMDEFDDSLPSEEEADTPEGFFRSFGAAFRRNSKWSVNQPVPEVGDMSADMAHVDAFYEFWFSFKSWREFPHPDEEDVESAESREERRWIERYNAKLREKSKKESFRRLRAFVELAHKVDPRVIAWREEQKAERERQRAEREAERQRREDAAKEAAAAEERRKVEEAAAAAEAKKQRQMEKKALQKERARLRKLCGAGDAALAVVQLPSEQVEALCSSLGLASLGALCEELSATHLSVEAKVAAASARLNFVSAGHEEDARRKEEAAAALVAAAKAAEKKEVAERKARLEEWNEEEVRLLRKAIDKFPLGTSRRWEQVQAYVRTRTVEEILDMVKHGLKTGKVAAPAATQAGPQIVKKRQANTVIKSDATVRDESFSDVDINLRGPAVKAAVAPVAVAAPTDKAPTAAPVAAAPVAAAQPVKAVPVAASVPVAAVQPAKAAAVPAAAVAITAEWSSADEVALVKALKEIPKDATDRWDQVAAAVGTKSKFDCAKRFKEMKMAYKSKKGGR